MTMSTVITEFVVNFHERKFSVQVKKKEKLELIKNRIELHCGVDLNDDQYALEIYDADIEDYVILNQCYLTELYRNSVPILNTSVELELRSLYSTDSVTEDLNQLESLRIIWLDRYIGQPGDYSSLKRTLNSVINSNSACYPSAAEQRDLENLIHLGEVPANHLVKFFVDPEDCSKFIHDCPISTKIFLIISDEFSQYIIPNIADRVDAIYLFSPLENISMSFLIHYIDSKPLLFRVELDLLARLTRDIAKYWLEQGILQLKTDWTSKATTYLSHAKKLFLRANTLDQAMIVSPIEYINQKLDQCYHIENLSVECTEL